MCELIVCNTPLINTLDRKLTETESKITQLVN